ncbi:unnamed protein product [Paramecium primaurelia]|uniref:Uncharacterized protein n=1 Tax=Paramecium primaurelia TaxID=5886 RepID=A0A8S1M985_PARPR|nr:unnamed protein product [Paramecium primaurelia]
MGALCPRSSIEVINVEQNQNEIMIDPQIEIETLINQETNYKLSLSRNFSLNNPTLQTCDEVIQSILSISLSFMVKDFSEQINFLKLQIHKQIQELINHQIDFQDELLKMLIDYYEFLSYVQENSATKVVSWWKEPKTIVDLQNAIKHWSQQFFKFGGRLRREKAFRQLNFEPKTPERFVKTREWIKKQTEGQQDQTEPKQSQTIERNLQIEDGFEEL